MGNDAYTEAVFSLPRVTDIGKVKAGGRRVVWGFFMVYGFLMVYGSFIWFMVNGFFI